MSAYKYSCPYCGQHIEYTDGYCGKQMACPMCQQNTVFPALSPGDLQGSLRVSRTAQQGAKQNRSFKPGRMLAALRGFEHWNVVGQCLIPFVILAGALFVAAQLRSNPVEKTASTPAAAVDPATWEKMTQLAKAEEVVKQQLQMVNVVYAQDAQARQYLSSLHYSHGAGLNPATAQATFKRAEDTCVLTGNALSKARNSFELAMEKYESLGGRVNYRLQVPQ
jgi:hypothetical protein